MTVKKEAMTVVAYSTAIQPQMTARRWLFLPLVAGQAVATAAHIGREQASLCPVTSLLALALAALALMSDKRTANAVDVVLALACSLAFVVPSQQIGWLVLLLVGARLATAPQTLEIHRRSGQLLLLTAGLNLACTYSLKWFASPILSLDAYALAAILDVGGIHFELQGNVIAGPGDHQLLILRGCSSLLLMCNAALAWWAVMLFRGQRITPRTLALCAALLLLTLALNLVRLHSMVMQLHWHQWWHSDTGMQLFQLLSAAIVFALLALGGQYAQTR